MACSKWKETSQAVQLALSAFKTSCESSRRSCLSACDSAQALIASRPACGEKYSAQVKVKNDFCNNNLASQLGQIQYGL
jgi:hypothetical protein